MLIEKRTVTGRTKASGMRDTDFRTTPLPSFVINVLFQTRLTRLRQADEARTSAYPTRLS